MKMWIRAAALVAIAALAGCGGGASRRVVTDASIGSGQPVSGSYVGGAVPALGDSAPHVWTSGHPYNNQVHGVDVSRYQGSVDWATARAAGISFAFLKATEGGDHSDPAFPAYWAQTRAAGIPRGAYHFYYFCRSGAEQAAWFIANVPRERGALPPVVDLEWVHNSRTCRYQPSPAEIHQEVGTFMAILTQYYGQRPIVYTTVDFYRDAQLGRMNAEFWLRSVADHPRGTYPGQRWSFWQYTGTGTAPGFRGNVDLNTFAGNRAQWNRWLASRMQR
ncbi:GH25 family lysozyme [Paracoccus contaminans]|uniref:Glycoside hydrolase n=1 Tax=Paracoccus contaminans TaxID=1945662 RepID=A0A1W6CTW7_9RHOB|nr:GH25 family lysozyme [Paracoccus contaminans]ARJ68327.1 glycoside hydrolase [Paracoccus contaminans]